MRTPSSPSCVGWRTRSRSSAVDASIHAASRLKHLAFGPGDRPLGDSDVKPPLPDATPEPQLPTIPPPPPVAANSIARRTRSRFRGVKPSLDPHPQALICIDSDEDERAHPPPPPKQEPEEEPEEEPRSILSDSISAVGFARRDSDPSVSVAAAEEDHVDGKGILRVETDDAVEGEEGGGVVDGDTNLESTPPIGSELGSNRGSSATTAVTRSSEGTFGTRNVTVGEEEVGKEREEEKVAVVVETLDRVSEGADRGIRRGGGGGVDVVGGGGGGERGSASLLESNNGTRSRSHIHEDPVKGFSAIYGCCIANRTRSKLWFGKEMEPVSFSKYFAESDSSDEGDYVWKAASSSVMSSSESTFGDGSSFWSEAERSGGDDDSDGDGEEVRLSGDEGSIGIPFGLWRKHSHDLSSRSWRKKSSWVSLKRREKKRKWSGGTSSGKPTKRRSTDDEDVDHDGEECGSSSWSAKRGQLGIASDPESKKKKRKKRKRSSRKWWREQQSRGGAIDIEAMPASISSSSSGYESDGLPEGGNVWKKKKRRKNDDILDDELTGRKGSTSKYRKKNLASKDESVHKFLDDILKKDGDIGLEDVDTTRGGEKLPLIFSFGDDDPKPAEKTKHEKAIDGLWDECDFALRSSDIGCYNVAKETQSFKQPEVGYHSSIPCVQENHDFIFDEEVGIVCKHCHSVALERRFVFPKFGALPGIYGRVLSEEKENLSILDSLCSKDKKADFAWLSGMSSGTVWDLIPGVKDTMYTHQQEGFEFMWRNLAGDIFLDKLKVTNSDNIGGCVISHAPGTGKTRLAIVFLQSFMAAYHHCRPVILAPRGMLLMWEKEFKRWKVNIPFHLLNGEGYSGKEDASALYLVRNKPKNNRWMRIVKLLSWNNGDGILGVSYGLFEKLVGKKYKHHAENEKISNILIERPGLFIFDEGHTPRNERSSIWKVLEKVKAERRIILSGTPFQNNFGELYNTLCLVRPKFVEKMSSKKSIYGQKYAEFSACKDIFNIGKDAGKGKWDQLTSLITGENLEELRQMMSPFVHVHNGSILKKLPGHRECVVFLELAPIQKELISRIESSQLETTFGLQHKISLATIHPSLYVPGSEEGSALSKRLQDGRLNPDEGVKTRFVVELVRLSLALREKVLIFSQYIDPLLLMKEQLISLFHWTEGKEILQMDGTIGLKNRQASIDTFNSTTSEAKVLLASTRACCEGISLTGASRVVLLDVVWNPSVENQAISRAFRLGQEKVVYTYHLIASGTGEINKYSKQVEKERISDLVFSSVNESMAIQDNPQCLFEDKILEEMKGHEKIKSMFKQIMYQPKNSSMMDAFDLRWGG